MNNNHNGMLSSESSVVLRISKEIAQEYSNDHILILTPSYNENISLRAFYLLDTPSARDSQSPEISSKFQQECHQRIQSLGQGQRFSNSKLYQECVIEILIQVPKSYPHLSPRFKFPQRPMHPSLKGETICCGVCCEFKKNWEPSQTLYSGLEKFCKSISNIPLLIEEDERLQAQITSASSSTLEQQQHQGMANIIDLTRDCNFEIIGLIRSNRPLFMSKCSKWAQLKGHLSNYFQDKQLLKFMAEHSQQPIVQKIKKSMEQITERRTAAQICYLLKEQSLNMASLSRSQIMQILALTKQKDVEIKDEDKQYHQQ